MSGIRQKMKDMKLPDPIEVPLRNGNKAVIGEITLETLAWAEEKHGSWDKFQEKVFGEDSSSNFHDIVEFLFQILENQGDFQGEEEEEKLRSFRKVIGIRSFHALKDALVEMMNESMPEAEAASDGGGVGAGE